eukprot:3163436-Rhodomonas_salina.1
MVASLHKWQHRRQKGRQTCGAEEGEEDEEAVGEGGGEQHVTVAPGRPYASSVPGNDSAVH